MSVQSKFSLGYVVDASCDLKSFAEYFHIRSHVAAQISDKNRVNAGFLSILQCASARGFFAPGERETYHLYRAVLLKRLRDVGMTKSILNHLLPQGRLPWIWLRVSSIFYLLKGQTFEFTVREEQGFYMEYTFVMTFGGVELNIVTDLRRYPGSRSLALHHYKSFTVWKTSES